MDKLNKVDVKLGQALSEVAPTKFSKDQVRRVRGGIAVDTGIKAGTTSAKAKTV
jgi:hypothetical protein